jgi:hypothetical protein
MKNPSINILLYKLIPFIGPLGLGVLVFTTEREAIVLRITVLLSLYLVIYLISNKTPWGNRCKALIEERKKRYSFTPTADINENIRLHTKMQAAKKREKQWWELWL